MTCAGQPSPPLTLGHPTPQPEEAVSTAIAEFQSQGVDMSNIITSTTGGDLTAHPLTPCVHTLRSSLQTLQATTAPPSEHKLTCLELKQSLDDINDILRTSTSSIGPVALSLRLIPSILQVYQWSNDIDGIYIHIEDVLVAAASTATLLLPLSPDLRRSFRECEGPTLLVDALTHSIKAGPMPLTHAILLAIAASTVKDEEGKGELMVAGLGQPVIQCLTTVNDGHKDEDNGSGSNSNNSSNAVVMAACGVLSSLMSADDDTVPSSRAFANVRELGAQGAVEAVVGALRILLSSFSSPDTDSNGSNGVGSEPIAIKTICSVCTALQKLSANDEICRQVDDAGGVVLGLEAADKGLRMHHVALSKCSIALLRQLASSDVVKAEIVSGGGLELVSTALRNVSQSVLPVSVAEQALGLLTNCALRSPEVAEAAVAQGVVAEALQTMKHVLSLQKDGITSAAYGSVLRQGCMALRNIAGRSSEEVKEQVLAAGAERVVRASRLEYPSACQDVGSAALRDLGLNNYK